MRGVPGVQGTIPSDPGIRGPLHPPRRRCPPSPYRGGYASVGRLAGCGASALSVLGLFGNGPLDAGGLWSEEEIASSGTGSERAKIASAAERNPPASQGTRAP